MKTSVILLVMSCFGLLSPALANGQTVILETTWVDLEIPAASAQWYHYNPTGVITDLTMQELLSCFGLSTPGKRNSLVAKAGLKVAAYSGYPITVAPDYFQNYPWDITVSIVGHEIGHNLGYEHDFPGQFNAPSVDKYFHHGMTLVDLYLPYQIHQKMAALNVKPYLKESYDLWWEDRLENFKRAAEELDQWISAGKKTADLPGGAPKIGSAIVYSLFKIYGPDCLLGALRLMGDSRSGFSWTDHQLDEPKKSALMVAIFSAAAGKDLETFFNRYGLDFNVSFFRTILPTVQSEKAALQLPATEKIPPHFAIKGQPVINRGVLKSENGLYLGVDDRFRLIPVTEIDRALTLTKRAVDDYVQFYAENAIQALNLENSPTMVRLSTIKNGWGSADWKLLSDKGKTAIQNRWQPGYLSWSADQELMMLTQPSTGWFWLPLP